ncbi:hypothetical protein LX36DRAFT_728412 [Colletotrichum falcatum]|nr:hypothetical protein LX36DRAFT_728412 [Colletotrichum falcatum]
MGAVDVGRAPFNYGTLPHDGWRDILPFVIDMYKNNASSMDFERAMTWYKLVPAILQIEYLPDDVMDDNIFFFTLLIEGNFYQGSEGDGAGMYLGECRPGNYEGSEEDYQTRFYLQLTGEAILFEFSCRSGFSNFNAYFMSSLDPASLPAEADDFSNLSCVTLPVWSQSLFDPPYCTEGKSFDSAFDELYHFNCAHGFFSICHPILEEYFNDMNPGHLNCDPLKAPKNLDDMVNAADSASIPAICWGQWALNILFTTLLGFNDEFYRKRQGFESFMTADTSEGKRYFDCMITLPGHKYDKMSCQCLGLNKFRDGSWMISLRDSDGFYAAALDKLGIEKDYRPTVGAGSRPCVKLRHKKTSAPICVDKDTINVPNPKEGFQAAMPNMSALAKSLMIAQVDLTLHINEAGGGDIITAASVPIFMLEQAIRSMDNIKANGSKIIKENEKKLILEILCIVFIAILFGGMAVFSRIAALVDIVGPTGLTAHDIVQDPTSASFSILGLLVGGFGTGVGSEKEAFGEAAKVRRGVSVSDIAKLGDDFLEKDTTVQEIVNGCLRVQ